MLILAASVVSAAPRVAVVLSGGSAFGIAHVGVLKVLEEEGVPIDMVLGTSMGSIVSGLYAAGYSPAEMESIVASQDWNAVFMDRRDSPGDSYDREKRRRYALGMGFDRSGLSMGSGLLEGQNILALFTQLTMHVLPVRSFDALPVPYRAVAAEVLSGDRVVFDSGSIAEAMRSSMSIPALFRPFEVNGELLVDGGIIDNMPVDLARSLGADIVIAVESRGAPVLDARELKSSVQIAAHTAGLLVDRNMRPNREAADLLIIPDLAAFTTASYDEAEALVRRGYEGADARRADIRALARKIAAARPLPSPDAQANRTAMRPLPQLAGIEVQGSTEARRDAVRERFRPLVGARADAAAIRAAIDDVYEWSEFDLVKFDMKPAAGGAAIGVITLVPDTTPQNAVLLGVDYRGVIASASTSRMSISPAVVVRDITNPESALFAEASLVNGARIYAEFFQPFGPFHVKPWARYLTEHDVYTFANETAQLDLLFRAAGGGVQAGISAGGWLDFAAGYSLENVKTSLNSGSLMMAEAQVALVADTLSRPVFPDRGIHVLALGRWASEAIGSQIELARMDVEAYGGFRLGSRLSGSAAAFLSTDFYGYLPGAVAAPDAFYSSLRRPGMFYGFTERGERVYGDHAAGASLELRWKFGKINPLLGGDIYGLVNASAGTVQTKEILSDSLTDALPLRMSFAAGAGARVTDSFGILAAFCLNADQGSSAPLAPAFTLEFGSFAPRRENRR